MHADTQQGHYLVSEGLWLLWDWAPDFGSTKGSHSQPCSHRSPFSI